MSSDMPIGPDTHLAVPDHVLSRRFSGETVLLSLADEQYYSLDGVGTLVWELVEQGTTLGEAVRAVTTEYDIDAVTAEADLQALLGELRRNSLVLAS